MTIVNFKITPKNIIYPNVKKKKKNSDQTLKKFSNIDRTREKHMSNIVSMPLQLPNCKANMKSKANIAWHGINKKSLLVTKIIESQESRDMGKKLL